MNKCQNIPSTGTLLIVLTVLAGCANLPVRDETVPDGSLVILGLAGNGSVFSLFAGGTYTDWPTRFTLRNLDTSQEYEGVDILGGETCFANIPSGRYAVQNGKIKNLAQNSPYVWIPVDFTGLEISFELKTSGSYFLGDYPYEFKQRRKMIPPGLVAVSMSDRMANYSESCLLLEKIVNKWNKGRGWMFQGTDHPLIDIQFRRMTVSTDLSPLPQPAPKVYKDAS